MPCRQQISFTERLTGLGVCLLTIPVAGLATILLMPLWSWLEASFAIESVGHSGPAGWCYQALYLVVVCLAGVLWAQIRRNRQRGKE